MMPNIYKFNIGSDFVVKASRAIESFIVEQKEGVLNIALSGGSSPEAVYERLARSEKIDWSRVEIYQVDERSDRSNAKMIRESLVSKIPTLRAFHEFDDHYEKKLGKLGKPLFDLVLLGLGEDGHTASIFPHSETIETTDVLVTRSLAPSGVKERRTLTFPAIMSSRKIIFLIRGAGKKETVKKWLEEDSLTEAEIPAKVILDHDNVDIYFDYSTK